jgi:dihydropteroate synthase
VAEAAIEAGATMINDVSASLWPVAASAGIGWIAMHMQGEPATMQRAPRYDDVVGEVRAFLADRAERAVTAGVTEVWVDPGIGFGKSLRHNLSLLRHLDEIVAIGYPVVVGTSRKGFLGALTDDAPADDRLEASLATAVIAAAGGARMVRAHDVLPTVHAMRIVGEEVAA